MMLLLVLALPALAQWQPDQRLTNDTGSSRTSYNNAWCVAASGDTIHVVWRDDRDGNTEIYYKRSTDAGVSWGSDTRLTSDVGNSAWASLAVAGSAVHVTWTDDRDGNAEIYYKGSSDGGATWGSDTRLSNDPHNSFNSSVAASGSQVHVVWHDDRDGNAEIYYNRSTDAGTTWSGDTRLTNDSHTSQWASVAVAGAAVRVVWRDDRDGNLEVYYKRSTDGGASWGSDTRLTTALLDAGPPSIAVAGNPVHVVWADPREGNPEIYYKRSTDGGGTWSDDLRLTSDTCNSDRPSVAVAGNVVHVVWYDTRDGTREIYYKRSTDGGTSWGSDTRLTNDSSESDFPSVATAGNAVHVVWHDTRDGNYEIYYKRDPTGSSGAEENPEPQVPSFKPTATIVRSVLRLPVSPSTIHTSLFDMTGRQVMALCPGPNDVNRLNPGVYFVREASGARREASSVRKVVIQR
jgi:hypothetical protein